MVGQTRFSSCATTRENTGLTRVVPKFIRSSSLNAGAVTDLWALVAEFTR